MLTIALHAIYKVVAADAGGDGHGDGNSGEDDDPDSHIDLLSKDKNLDLGVSSTMHAQQAGAISALKQELKHMDEIFEVAGRQLITHS
jgi:hypothetical protein